jgi:hypothetical protein
MGVWKITNGERVLKRFLPLSLVVLALAAAPALAEVAEGNWYLEGGLGYYIGGGDDTETDEGFPDELEIENDYLINFRAGWFLAENRGVEGQLWYSETTGTRVYSATFVGGVRHIALDFDTNVYGFDVSAVFCLNPSSKHNLFVVGGVGYANVDMAGVEDEDTLTVHFGLAARISMTKHFYFRPDVRYLYMNGIDFRFREGDSKLNNILITVSTGWAFGKQKEE